MEDGGRKTGPPSSVSRLNSIHEGLLDAVEDRYADGHDHDHETKAIEQLHPVH